MVEIKKKIKVCISGAGAAGGILALELSKQDLFEVVLLDLDTIADRVEPLPLVAKFDRSSASFDETRGYGFGGSTKLWHGVLTNLDDSDWQQIDDAAESKISNDIACYFEMLEPYFPGVHSKFSTKLDSSSGRFNLIYHEIFSNKIFSKKEFIIQKKPLRIKQLLQKNQSIEFIERAIALYLLPNKDNLRHAQSLVYWQDGESKTIDADVFIISTGAFESPRLILQSIEKGFEGLTNQNIGRNLMDHPWAIIGEIASKKGLFNLSLSDSRLTASLSRRIGIRLNPHSKLNHSLALKPLFLDSDIKEVLKYLVKMKVSISSIKDLLVRFRLRDLIGCLLMIFSELTNKLTFVHRALVFCYLEQVQSIDSRVKLTGACDEYGRSIPEIQWLFDDEDLKEAHKISLTLAKALSKSDYFAYKPLNITNKSFSSGLHYAGTMRLSKSRVDGVVDSDLKLFGSENIYVCDLSIFPKYGNSNPTYVLGAFAARLSRHLISKFNV
jgi:GMC oxidoreductase